MIDRQKVESILSRRFPAAPLSQIAAAANAIMGLGDEWEEVDPLNPPRRTSESCRLGSCALTGLGDIGTEIRVLRRRAEKGGEEWRLS